MLPVQQFQIMTPEQMNPLSGVVPAFQQAYLNQLKANQMQQQNQYNPQIMQNQVNQGQLQNENQQLQNKYYPDEMKSKIAAQDAMANYRNNGGGRMGVGQQQLMALQNQVSKENQGMPPEQVEAITNAYLNGEETLPDGSPLPPMSGITNSMLAQVYKRNSTVGLQNTAASLDITAEDLKKIPIDSIAAFSGPKGRARYAQESLMMQTNPDAVSQEFRDYQSYIKAVKNLDMDSLRKAFGTSVVPEYVSATLGDTINPNSTIWNDEKQARKQLQDVYDWVNESAKMYGKKAKFGAAAKLDSPAMKAFAGNKVKASDGKEYTEEEIDRMLGVK